MELKFKDEWQQEGNDSSNRTFMELKYKKDEEERRFTLF